MLRWLVVAYCSITCSNVPARSCYILVSKVRHGSKPGTGTAATYPQLCLPEPFGDGDVETWLRRFNLCAEANRWAADDKLLRLSTLLRGRAFAVYECLEDHQKDTYAHLVAALPAAFEPRTEERRRLATRQLTSRILQPEKIWTCFFAIWSDCWIPHSQV